MEKIVIKAVSSEETSPSGEVINESKLFGTLKLELDSSLDIDKRYINTLKDCMRSLVDNYCAKEGEVFQITVE